MATVVAIRLKNIVSITQGSNVYEGVRSVGITGDKGALTPILKEGDLYPTGSELVGTPNFPITTSVEFEQDVENIFALLAEAKASLVVVYQAASGVGTKTVTITNHEFSQNNFNQQLQSFGRPGISGVAHATPGAGNALPIAFS